MLVGHKVYYAVLAVGIEFAAGCVFIAEHVASILDYGYLHTKTYSEVRHVVFSGILTSKNLSFHASVAKAAGYKYTVDIGKHTVAACIIFDILCFNPFDIHLASVFVTAVS